jgi:hypothetical protein
MISIEQTLSAPTGTVANRKHKRAKSSQKDSEEI